MGIFCQIHIHKPQGGNYKPGDELKGLLKYALSKETKFKNITVSLLGHAQCRWSEGYSRRRTHYSNKETLYKIDTNLTEAALTGFTAGSYQAPFNFILPLNIPSTYKDKTARINHFIVIKFERPGIFNRSKVFNTEITVRGDTAINELNEPPVIYGERSKMTNILTGKSGAINIKGIMKKLTIKPGEELFMDCVIENESFIRVLKTKISVRERITYTASCGHKRILSHRVGDCKTTFNGVASSSTSKFRPAFKTPADIWPIQYTKVMKKEYFVLVTAKLPKPRWNMNLMIPLNVGDEDEVIAVTEDKTEDQPPSYWETMGEDKGITWYN